MKYVCLCASNNPERYIPEAYLFGANYSITIRHKACWSQLELGFNWIALIGLLHLEVESNVAANSRCEVAKCDLKCSSYSETFSPPQPDRHSVLLMDWSLVALCLVVHG